MVGVIGVLEAGRRQAVGRGVPLHHLGRLVGAERVRTVPLADAVEDVGDLEAAPSRKRQIDGRRIPFIALGMAPPSG